MLTTQPRTAELRNTQTEVGALVKKVMFNTREEKPAIRLQTAVSLNCRWARRCNTCLKFQHLEDGGRWISAFKAGSSRQFQASQGYTVRPFPSNYKTKMKPAKQQNPTKLPQKQNKTSLSQPQTTDGLPHLDLKQYFYSL